MNKKLGQEGHGTVYSEDIPEKIRALGFSPKKMTMAMMARRLGINLKTMQGWCNKNSAQFRIEVKEAVEDFRNAQLALWEETGINAMPDKNFNTPMYSLLMSNIYNYKTAKSDNSIAAVVAEDDAEKVNALIKRYREEY